MLKQFDIQIVEGGESLYVTPFYQLPFAQGGSFKPPNIHIFTSSEFKPGTTDLCSWDPRNHETSYQMFALLKQVKHRRYHGGIFHKRVINNSLSIITYIRYNLKIRFLIFKHLLQYLGFDKYIWRCAKDIYHITIPVLAHDLCPVTFSIRNQLMVSGNDTTLTETVYLKPSRKYLLLRMQEYLDSVSNYSYQEEDKTVLREWLKDKDPKYIEFIYSLDT